MFRCPLNPPHGNDDECGKVPGRGVERPSSTLAEKGSRSDSDSFAEMIGAVAARLLRTNGTGKIGPSATPSTPSASIHQVSQVIKGMAGCGTSR